MRNFRTYALALGLAAAVAPISSASASLLQFNLGGQAFVFDEDTPTSYVLGKSTTFDVPTTGGHWTLTFFSQASGGGAHLMGFNSDTFNGIPPTSPVDETYLSDIYRPHSVIALYSGPESAPDFIETPAGQPIHFSFLEGIIHQGPGRGDIVGVNPLGVDVTIVAIAAVPEPSTWAMLMLGFAGLGFLGLRKKGSRQGAVAV